MSQSNTRKDEFSAIHYTHILKQTTLEHLEHRNLELRKRAIYDVVDKLQAMGPIHLLIIAYAIPIELFGLCLIMAQTDYTKLI